MAAKKKMGRGAVRGPFFLRPTLPLRPALLFLAGFVPVVAIQLLAWKAVFGSLLTYSYGSESFIYATSPKVLSVLFSSKHGLVSWNPVILFALAGLVVLAFSRPRMAWLFSIAFLLQLYIAASWHMWWFGNSFGNRSFINCTLIFMTGLACLTDRLGRRIPVAYIVALATVLVAWNMVMILAYLSEMIPYADYFSWKDFVLGLGDMPEAILKKAGSLARPE